MIIDMMSRSPLINFIKNFNLEAGVMKNWYICAPSAVEFFYGHLTALREFEGCREGVGENHISLDINLMELREYEHVLPN